jgi:biuret amidohydrolase
VLKRARPIRRESLGRSNVADQVGVQFGNDIRQVGSYQDTRRHAASSGEMLTPDRHLAYGRPFAPPVVLERSATALLIIDMQYSCAASDQGSNLAFDRLDPGSCEYFIERVETSVIPAIQALLAYFRRNEMLIVYLTLGSYDRDLTDMPERQRQAIRTLERETEVPDILWAGNPAFQIREEVAPHGGELVVNKTTFGAFNSSQLDRILRERGTRSLVITGVSTNCCVESTARDAADRGFACVLVDEALADYDEYAHMATLLAFHGSFGRVVTGADDIFAAIDERAPLL